MELRQMPRTTLCLRNLAVCTYVSVYLALNSISYFQSFSGNEKGK